MIKASGVYNMAKRIDITGNNYGDLTVIKLSDQRNDYGKSLWECLCSCGDTTHVLGASLRSGHYKSCGCKRINNRDQGARSHEKSDSVDGTRITALKQKMHKDNKSGHKGIMFMDKRGKWKAYIGFKGKQINLGHYNDLKDAIQARKEGEIKYHKPYLGGVEK